VLYAVLLISVIGIIGVYLKKLPFHARNGTYGPTFKIVGFVIVLRHTFKKNVH